MCARKGFWCELRRSGSPRQGQGKPGRGGAFAKPELLRLCGVTSVLLNVLCGRGASRGAGRVLLEPFGGNRRYGREFAKTAKLDPEFHRRLIDAQDYRNIGDYGISAHVQPEQAERVCGWALEFLVEANKYFRLGEF